MALRKILTDGDTALHKMCRPVTSFDARLHTLLDDLKETLADANGAGLAAPRWGFSAGWSLWWTPRTTCWSWSTPKLSPRRGAGGL